MSHRYTYIVWGLSVTEHDIIHPAITTCPHPDFGISSVSALLSMTALELWVGAFNSLYFGHVLEQVNPVIVGRPLGNRLWVNVDIELMGMMIMNDHPHVRPLPNCCAKQRLWALPSHTLGGDDDASVAKCTLPTQRKTKEPHVTTARITGRGSNLT